MEWEWFMRRQAKNSQTRHYSRRHARLLEVDESNHIDELTSEGKVGQELVGISDGQLRTLFDMACQLLEAQQCEGAVRGFSLLCQLHPYIADFWLGLAQARRLSGEPEQAVSALLMAETMDTHRPEVISALVETHLELGDIKGAERTLRRARRHLHDKGLSHSEKQAVVKEVERLDRIITSTKR